MRALLLLLALSSCAIPMGEPIPGFTTAIQLGDAVEPPPAGDVAIAIATFAGAYVEAFADNDVVATACNGVRITWSAPEAMAPYSGIAHDMRNIQVALVPGRPLSHSALHHELLHIVLERLTGDPDRTHAQEDGPWTPAHDDLLESSKARLAAQGL